MSTGADNRMVKLCEFWERTWAKGTRYFSGFMGGCQVSHVRRRGEAAPDAAGRDGARWHLMVQEKDPDRRPQARAEPARREPALV